MARNADRTPQEKKKVLYWHHTVFPIQTEMAMYMILQWDKQPEGMSAKVIVNSTEESIAMHVLAV